MARTIQEIYDSMITEKETFSSLDELVPNPESSQTFLQDLTSASKVAIWRLLMWVVAFAIFTHESLFDVYAATVEERAKDIIPATSRNLVIVAKEFQYGDDLVFDDATGKFSYVDTTSPDALDKQIVSQASVLDANRVVTYKIAKDDGAGGLEKLDTAEKTAFETYIDQTKVAGTKTIVITDDADFLKVAYTIQYDPLVLKADGSLIEDGSFPIQEAIDAYIQGLPFDSEFRVMDLTDSIQLARGVNNAVADVVEAKGVSIDDYQNILNDTRESYLPVAGHMKTVDETGSELSPVIGSINVLTPTDYEESVVYSPGDFTRYQGVVYKNNTTTLAPEDFDPDKWDTVSNLTFVT